MLHVSAVFGMAVIVVAVVAHVALGGGYVLLVFSLLLVLLS